MNRQFRLLALIALVSIPAISCASESIVDKIRSSNFVYYCVTLPKDTVHTACHTSPRDMWNQATNMTFAKLPIVSSFLQDANQHDYAAEPNKKGEYPLIKDGRFYAPFNYLLLTAAVFGGGGYAIARKWKVRTRLMNATKYAKNKIGLNK